MLVGEITGSVTWACLFIGFQHSSRIADTRPNRLVQKEQTRRLLPHELVVDQPVGVGTDGDITLKGPVEGNDHKQVHTEEAC